MSKISNLKSYILNPTSGFTLVELMIVFAAIGILSTMGIASFVGYSRTQSVNTTAQDVITNINLAKSRARTQVKPQSGICDSLVLEGYQINIISAASYQVEAKCQGSVHVISVHTLPQNIVFESASVTKTFLFKVLSGSVDMPSGVANDTVELCGHNKKLKIAISSNGRVAIDPLTYVC